MVDEANLSKEIEELEIVESTEENVVIKQFRFQQSGDEKYILPLYTNHYLENEYLFTHVIDRYEIIDKDKPLIEIATLIAEHVSEQVGGLEIEVEIDDIGEGVLCLDLTLIDPDTEEAYYKNNWSQAFAASGETTATLRKILPNFLQKDYKGPWIDLLRFEDTGDGIHQHEYYRYEDIDTYTLD